MKVEFWVGMDQFIFLEEMVIGNNKFIKILFLIFLSVARNISVCQTLNCYTKQLAFKVDENDIEMIANDYIRNDSISNSLLVVDFYMQDTLGIYRIVKSEYLELLYKRPECFMEIGSNMVYISTLSYYNNKDTAWLDNLLELTLKQLLGDQVSVKNNWKENRLDSIIGNPGKIIIEDEMKNLFIMEYQVVNHRILSKKLKKRMILPDLFLPKGYSGVRWFDNY